ncbi:hypothetical protein DCAR_0205795 [Daucus carota subsp. sativus]|uniref:Uncharacterized protein n=1 Tax=Daucus carota subsp. sativus TaxID=79200 RepID=A0A161Y4V8_DAUCS|nr:hypothetical protein DCAR_0205795 [Daucus carota subsp. sativus]
MGVEGAVEVDLMVIEIMEVDMEILVMEGARAMNMEVVIMEVTTAMELKEVELEAVKEVGLVKMKLLEKGGHRGGGYGGEGGNRRVVVVMTKVMTEAALKEVEVEAKVGLVKMEVEMGKKEECTSHRESMGTEQGNPMQCGSRATHGSNSAVQAGSLDMRAEWQMGKVSHGTDLTDDDDDFVIPVEHFGKTKPRRMQSKGGKETKLYADAERAKGSRRKVVNKGMGKKGRSTAGVNRKCSPSNIKDILRNLTEEQANWVRSTGCGELLNFDMVCYAHMLGYNLGQAFDVENCAPVLKCCTIEINDRLVNNVLGIPMGELVLTASETEPNVAVWCGQFDGKAGCEISPLTVRNKLLEREVADKIFKLNLLVMLYNFFIEGHQIRYLNRDVIKSDLDLDACAQYNWCRLLIDKLQSSYAYWVAEKKRSFTGSLPFLIDGIEEYIAPQMEENSMNDLMKDIANQCLSTIRAGNEHSKQGEVGILGKIVVVLGIANKIHIPPICAQNKSLSMTETVTAKVGDCEK